MSLAGITTTMYPSSLSFNAGKSPVESKVYLSRVPFKMEYRNPDSIPPPDVMTGESLHPGIPSCDSPNPLE